MEIGDLNFSYGNIALLALAVFLLAGVYSFVKQGLKIAALIVLVLAALAATGGFLWA
ncbi:hypothetical protein [Actinomadura sp. GC306]|uniref:hypothetical protein n=1 Tax=Actinomadura sp. GC306 TaxID=2530367 RepID=UPI0014053A7C|nr:hypothetical protein [Actinomadura sp. GC306]